MSIAENRVAIVTGASSGIGAAVARHAAAEGYNVLVGYRSNGEGAGAVVDACKAQGVDAAALAGDVADDADCRALASFAQDRWGRIDVLVNNAGASVFHPHGDLEGIDAGVFQKLYQINAVGAFQMIRAVVPVMKVTGGRIVNVASVAGVFGVGSSLPYACSKAAMLALNKSMARELGPEICVNAVCPGMVEGDWLREGLGEEGYGRTRDRLKQQAATGEVMNADTVADNIWFFAAGASNVTGEQLILDGGANLRY